MRSTQLQNFVNVHFPAAPRWGGVLLSSQHSPGEDGKTATRGTFIYSYTLLKMPSTGSGARAWGLRGKPVNPGGGGGGGGPGWGCRWVSLFVLFFFF